MCDTERDTEPDPETVSKISPASETSGCCFRERIPYSLQRARVCDCEGVFCVMGMEYVQNAFKSNATG